MRTPSVVVTTVEKSWARAGTRKMSSEPVQHGGGQADVVMLSSSVSTEGGFRVVDGAAPGGPLVLLYSEDLGSSADAVRAAGGAVVQEPFVLPGGRRSRVNDPSGNERGVWTAKPRSPS